MNEGAKGHAGGAFGEPRLGVVVPGGTGDVQVNPRRVASEFLDEHGAGNGAAAFAAADVLDIGDGSLDEIAVVVVDGHLPHFFADGFGAGEELVGKGLVGAEDADVDVGEGDDDGTGKGGGVDEMRGTKLLSVVDAVGEDEATFCIGVEDFDGFARHCGLNVARLLRGAAGHVFGGRHDADHFNAGLEGGEGTHHAEHGGAASHVVLHFFHAVGGLDGNAPSVEGDGFADETDYRGPRLWICGRISDDHKAGRLGAALRDAEERAHLEAGDLLFVEDFNGQAGFLWRSSFRRGFQRPGRLPWPWLRPFRRECEE